MILVADSSDGVAFVTLTPSKGVLRWGTRQRTGFTLLELLVVIAIIVVLIGLLLPAVQKVREAAVRIRSANKLKQISLAAHNFETSHGSLPSVDGSANVNRGEAFMTALLPYLEWEAFAPKDEGILMPSIFRSPADPTFGTIAGREGSSSYAGNAQLFLPSPIAVSSIWDGSSSTLMLAEHFANCGPVTSFSWSQRRSICFDGQTGAIIPCVNHEYHRATFADPLYGDVLPVTAEGISRASIPGSTFQTAPAFAECDPHLAQTPHPGGMLVALADGSVRTLSPSTAEEIYWGAVTPNGNEVLGAAE